MHLLPSSGWRPSEPDAPPPGPPRSIFVSAFYLTPPAAPCPSRPHRPRFTLFSPRFTSRNLEDHARLSTVGLSFNGTKFAEMKTKRTQRTKKCADSIDSRVACARVEHRRFSAGVASRGSAGELIQLETRVGLTAHRLRLARGVFHPSFRICTRAFSRSPGLRRNISVGRGLCGPRRNAGYSRPRKFYYCPEGLKRVVRARLLAARQRPCGIRENHGDSGAAPSLGRA